MEFCSGDDLSQLFHVGRFDIHYVEALVLNIEVPKVDPEIVTANEGLAIAVYGNAVDVVCVSGRICPSWNGSNDRVMMGHAR